MPSADPRTIRILTDLVLALDRAEAVYRNESADETNYELQNIERDAADLRERFAAGLRRELTALSGSAPEKGAGTEEAWADVEEEDEDAAALGLYEEALDEDLPDSVRSLLERQYDLVSQDRDHLLQIRNLVSDSPLDGNSDTLDSAVEEPDPTEPRDILPDDQRG